jgi:hypothetical protein
MPTSVICPGCKTPFSVADTDGVPPTHCEKCRPALIAEQGVDEAPPASLPTSPQRKSRALLWTVLGVTLALVLFFTAAGGYLVYAVYKWIEGAPSNPSIQGEPPPTLPRKLPGGAPAPNP